MNISKNWRCVFFFLLFWIHSIYLGNSTPKPQIAPLKKFDFFCNFFPSSTIQAMNKNANYSSQKNFLTFWQNFKVWVFFLRFCHVKHVSFVLIACISRSSAAKKENLVSLKSWGPAEFNTSNRIYKELIGEKLWACKLRSLITMIYNFGSPKQNFQTVEKIFFDAVTRAKDWLWTYPKIGDIFFLSWK